MLKRKDKKLIESRDAKPATARAGAAGDYQGFVADLQLDFGCIVPGNDQGAYPGFHQCQKG